jgi:GDP-4-dehydro-6-deoxy-D-mannose reductase
MTRILITGGTGFAASHLVEALYELGERDIHLTAYRDEGEFVKQFVAADHIHQVNLADQAATQALFEQTKPQQIYHLASIASVGDSFEKQNFVLEMNTAIQLNLLEAMSLHAPKARLLHISTALVYAKNDQPLNEQSKLGPDNPYSLSKLTQEMITQIFAKNDKLDIVIARPFNHIGERQALGFVVADLAAAIARIEKSQQENLPVGNLASIRDFTDVKDMVQAYILLMRAGKSGETYNLGSGRGTSIQDLLDTLISLAKTKINVQTDQAKIRPIDLPRLVCDNEKIKTLGWQPQHQLEKTLARILDYWRKNL